jgi:hypothetical protein
VSLRRRKLTAIAKQRQADDLDAVLQHKTDREMLELFASSGATLLSLAARVAGESDRTNADWSPDPDVLAKVVRRIELRLEHQLPHAECVIAEADRDPEASSCLCLRETLDESATLTRAGIVRAATKAHKTRWKWLQNKPAPRPPEPVSRPERVPPIPRPIPKPERVTETPTKPFRIVRKVRRWYDDEPGILNRQF